jgi:hypothetical protein
MRLVIALVAAMTMTVCTSLSRHMQRCDDAERLR